jgi:hypothetical protein
MKLIQKLVQKIKQLFTKNKDKKKPDNTIYPLW